MKLFKVYEDTELKAIFIDKFDAEAYQEHEDELGIEVEVKEVNLPDDLAPIIWT